MPPLPPRATEAAAGAEEGALARVRALAAGAPLLVLVYYRGTWDPFCVAWGRSLAHMRSLPARLDALHARLVFVSSQPRRGGEEAEGRGGEAGRCLDDDDDHCDDHCDDHDAAEEFHFGRDHPARRAGRVHFVRDEELALVEFANAHLGADVAVLPSSPDFADGCQYRTGIIQPAVVAVAAPWTQNTRVIARQAFKQGHGGPNGDVLDRPPACTVFRGIESAAVASTAALPR